MIRGRARETGEQQNLSESFADNHRQWAQILESFITNNGGAEAVPAYEVSRILAQRWHRAGRQLLHGKRRAEARDCFRRSCRWRKWNRAWVRLGMTYLQSNA